MYPDSAEIHGEVYDGIYKIDTSLDTARLCIAISKDKSIDDTERPLAIICLLFDFVPEYDTELFMIKAIKYLQLGKEKVEESTEKPDMDINFDWGYIVSSFMSEYGIDLTTTDIHFWKFMDLLQGLSENCALSRVRKIRNYKLSEIKDSKERTRIAEAQEAVKLPETLTAEEKQAIDEFEALF